MSPRPPTPRTPATELARDREAVTARSPRVELRPITPADDSFLRRVYASTREVELVQVPWTEEQKASFLDMQFDAQDRFYREHHAGQAFDVIEVEGQPAGRLYVARWPEEIRIVDIALLPEYRGRGVGTSLISALLQEASRTGRKASIHVECMNPAARLYRKLGFREVGDADGVHVLWEAHPSRDAPNLVGES